jgi:secreted trypsin-like serine protease
MFYTDFSKCGLRDTTERIANDREVGIWPWMASYGFKKSNGTWSHECGASLITATHLVTAAHCAQAAKRDSKM